MNGVYFKIYKTYHVFCDYENFVEIGFVKKNRKSLRFSDGERCQGYERLEHAYIAACCRAKENNTFLMILMETNHIARKNTQIEYEKDFPASYQIVDFFRKKYLCKQENYDENLCI